MILFVADGHYGARPGFHLHEQLKNSVSMEFHEDDFSALEQEDLFGKYDLIILNVIADTCGNPLPSDKAEGCVKAYLQSGGNMLLCHGSSAAFWHWDWWRSMVGFRWVRANDPDGARPSTHPVRPYQIKKTNHQHPLMKDLSDLSFPTDEIYINLQKVCEVETLMETETDEGTFPQVYLSQTPWGGELLTTLPGHASEVTTMPEYSKNIKAMIHYLLPSTEEVIVS
jgi:type 1 glutamine amidotransferase